MPVSPLPLRPRPDSASFRAFLLEFFAAKAGVFDAVDWQAWWNTPGMPPITPSFDDTLAKVGSIIIHAGTSDRFGA